MLFPLANRQLIRGAAAHLKAGLGVGADYVAVYVPLYAPVSGTTYLFGDDENTGGYWVGLRGDDGRDYQFAHMSDRRSPGRVNAGDIIGITGNTGTITTGPHLHVQIFVNGKRVDPEQVFAGAVLPGAQEDDVTREQAIDLIYLATQGHTPRDNERAFALGFPEDRLGDLALLRFRDDVVGGYGIASGWEQTPDSEKNFWQRYQEEHPEAHPVDSIARAWARDHVEPIRAELRQHKVQATALEQRTELAEGALERLGSENATLRDAEAKLTAQLLEQTAALKACRAEKPQTMTLTDMLITALRRILRIEP